MIIPFFYNGRTAETLEECVLGLVQNWDCLEKYGTEEIKNYLKTLDKKRIQMTAVMILARPTEI